jgi:hypothetical protein
MIRFSSADEKPAKLLNGVEKPPLTTNVLLLVAGVPGDMTMTLSVLCKFSLDGVHVVVVIVPLVLRRCVHLVQASFLATLIALMTR